MAGTLLVSCRQEEGTAVQGEIQQLLPSAKPHLPEKTTQFGTLHTCEGTTTVIGRFLVHSENFTYGNLYCTYTT